MLKLSFRAENGIGAIATSPSGRDVALAGRSGLYIVDLYEPYSPPRFLSLKTPWEVAAAQWCKHPNHYNRVVSTTSQKLVIWNLALPSHAAVEHVLHGHSRAITDVSFSKLSPDLLATCSIDTYVHIWDMRDPVRPCMTFADFEAGASQVKWSKTQPHLLASAHQNRLLLWDSRKQNIPLNEIAAHARRINSIDFDDSSNNNLATASIDRTIKVWNLNDLKKGGEQTPRLVMETTFPVWRTRYLPDGGNGAFVVPLRGADNNAFLADLSPRKDVIQFEPIQEFSRHKAPIKDLSIRREGNGYNLLTWSGDNTMSMWNVDESSLDAVNVPTTLSPIPPRDYTYRINPSTNNNNHKHRTGFFKMESNSMRSGNENYIDWIAGVQVGNGSPSEDRIVPHFSADGFNYEVNRGSTPAANLSKEVTAVSSKFPKVHFEQVDIANGRCVLTSRGPWGRDDEEFVVVRMHLYFPSDYPFAPLECLVEEDPNSDPTKIAEMEQFLAESASTMAKHGKPALEYILRYIMGDKMPIEPIIYEQSYHMDEIDEIYNSTDSEYGIRSVHENSGSEAEEAEDVDRKPDNQFIGGSSTKPKIDSTPLPVTCGAAWSNNGRLVIFSNIKRQKNVEANLYSIKALAGEEESDSESSISSFESDSGFESAYTGDARFPRHFNVNLRAWNQGSKKAQSLAEESEGGVGTLVCQILSMNHLLPCRPDMAAEYRFDFTLDNISEVTDHNAKIAEKYNRYEEAYIWRLSKYHAPASMPLDRKLLDNARGNNALLPFFNLCSTRFNVSITDALVEHLCKSNNYQLLVGLDCITSLLNTQKIEQLTKTFYYNEEDRPISFVPYFESNYSFHHPNRSRSTSPAKTPPQRALNRRRETSSVTTRKYSLHSVTHSNITHASGKSTSASIQGDDGHSQSSRNPSKATSEVSSLLENENSSRVNGGLSLKVKYLNPSICNLEVETDVNQGFDARIVSCYSEHAEDMAARRALYASMLDTWGLYIKRLEILNIPLPNGEFETAMDADDLNDEFMIGIKLVGKKTKKMRTTCVYCLQSLATQFVTCLRCNHVYHRKCLQEWSHMSSECATGCGCTCMQTKL